MVLCNTSVINTFFLKDSVGIEVMDLKILYEDNHLIAVDKPAGLLTQSDYSGDSSLLDIVKGLIKIRDNKPGNVYVGMVQRLDRPVSGVIFFAKTSKAASRLSEQIRQRKTEKYYIAVCEKRGTYFQPDQWKEHQTNLIRVKDVTRVTDSGGQQAILKAQVLAQNETYCCLLIRLITGRKHQIRAQLSHLGYTIVGDSKYGSTIKLSTKNRIALHAWSGVVLHPTRKDLVRCVSDLPRFYGNYFTEKKFSQIQQKLDRVNPG